MPNRLINSTSPYLLQHAHNPVDWHEWGEEALQKAKAEDKPILVSIGYSACHWCHVMERESFENKDIASIMNSNFICIKVDREERPDVDQVYMEAVQVMQVNGGWPLNVFLTPEQKPFYGGTYFPLPAWTKLLTQIGEIYKSRKQDVYESATSITDHLNRSDLDRFATSPDNPFNREQLDGMFRILVNRYDKTFGGLAKAPKFVMPTIWQWLLRYYHLTGNNEALEMVTFTLHQLTRAGLYDPVGGGFARYSVDAEWFAPHFEKMLYDNAQLLTLYAEAYQITKEKFYKQVLGETVDWIRNEMTSEQGGFYSALDADSEGVEGKFYTWTLKDFDDALGGEAREAATYFGVTAAGNWEHGVNILMKKSDTPDEKVARWKKSLYEARSKRIRPGLDDKILTGWNGMLIKGLVDASLATGNQGWLQMATAGCRFIEDNLKSGETLYRSYRNKRSNTTGFLEDYAFMITAYHSLYQGTQDEEWLTKAKSLCEHTMEQFFDSKEGYFRYVSRDAEQLIASKKEIFDNVIPASNSVMAQNLLTLGTLFDKQDWIELSKKMTTRLSAIIADEPAYMSNWGIVMMGHFKGLSEIAIAGRDHAEVAGQLLSNYLPFSVVQSATNSSTLPLMEGKTAVNGITTIYVCFNKTCKQPVHTVEAALSQLT